MKEIDRIIDSVTSSGVPVADVLRQCLVVSYTLKNPPFTAWVEHELKGYSTKDTLPDYREGTSIALGLFLDGLGTVLQNQPIPVHRMEDQHKHWATEVALRQPIAAYDQPDVEDIAFAWPPTLTAYYQHKLMQGVFLNRAWLPVPPSMLVSLVDTVKTRILSFALEIKAALPKDEDKGVEAIPPSVVNHIVNVTIMGGQNIVGDHATFTVNMIDRGDIKGLAESLKSVGLTDEDVGSLETSLKADGTYDVVKSKPQGIGEKTARWIARNAGKLANGGVKIGADVATDVLTDLIKQFLGLGG